MMDMKKTRDKEERLHSYNDKPAVIFADGTKAWFKHGKEYYPERT